MIRRSSTITGVAGHDDIRIRERFVLYRRLLTGFTVVLGILAATLPLGVVREVVESTSGKDTTVSIGNGFSVLSITSLLAALLLAIARVRASKGELSRLRRRIHELEQRAGVALDRSGDTPSGEASDTETAPGETSVAGQSRGAEGATPVTVVLPSAPQAENNSRWIIATVVTVVLASISGGFGIANTVLAREGDRVDCLAYSERLEELTARYSAQQLSVWLEGFRFDRYEDQCGDADLAVIGLDADGSRPTSTVPGATTSSTGP